MNIDKDFIGLTKRQAYELAEKLGLLIRLVRMGERELLGYPADTRSDRICIELDERKVSKASIQ